MTNALFIGLSKRIPLPKEGGFLYIDDEVPEVARSRIFDPREHCFNPLKGITYENARMLANVIYTAYPQGETTLTVRNGRIDLVPVLRQGTRFDKLKVYSEEVARLVGDILESPVLRRVLCTDAPFSFNPRSRILARINRAELAEFDAKVLAFMLMAHFRGTVIVPDFGFYGREAHMPLLRQNRLIAGVNFLDEVPRELRNALLLVKDKHASGATVEDAETLAKYARKRRDTMGYNDFIDDATA
jgi:hypothetical protein